MEYGVTLIAVRDIEASKRFYCQLLGMQITADFGTNVTLSGRLALQTIESWQGFIHKKREEIRLGHNAAELYFEERDIDSFMQKLAAWPDIRYLHPLKEHSWGQRVLRFYDPDGHIIEVGEDMSIVVRRFMAEGMSPEETALRMDVPVEYIRSCLQEL